MPTLKKQTDLTPRLQLARQAAQRAGQIMLAHYGRNLTISTKSSDLDLVTHVDLECDEVIREVLGEAYPEDRLITEESFLQNEHWDLESVWIVDPLDGTTNYAHAFPHFAVSIAYVYQGEVQVGVIFDPFKNEMFTAIKGGEVLKNGLPIKVSTTPVLSKALLATGFPYDIQTENSMKNNIDLHAQFLRLTHGIRRAGAAALDLAYVACGRLDGFWELRLSPWDIAAGVLMIECAGGKISGLSGETLDLAQRQINIVGSNTLLHDSLVDVTQAAAALFEMARL